MAKNKNHFCVIGLGEYGSSLAKSLAEKGAYVLAIDNHFDKIEEIKNYVSHAIHFDATDPVLLKEHGVVDADTVIVAIGEVFEPVVLICMELLNENVNRIIARCSSDTQELILQRIGVKEIIHPEKDEGKRMATSLLNESIEDYFQLSADIGIFEIKAPDGLVGHSVKELKLRERYKVNLITIKRPLNESIANSTEEEEIEYNIMAVIDPLTIIRKNDVIVLMGTSESLDKLIEIN